MFLQAPPSDFFSDIIDFQKTLIADSLADSSSFMLVAKTIAGVGLLISVLITYRKTLQDGAEIELPKFLGKYLLIFLAILFYGTLVRLINVPLDVMSNAIQIQANKQDLNTENHFNSFKFKTSEEYMYNAEMEEELAELNLRIGDPSENSISTNRKNGREAQEIRNRGARQNEENGISIWNYMAGDGIDSIKRALMSFIYGLIFYLGKVAVLVLNFVRTFFLTVLTIFGIFAIAISSYPGFEGSFNKWLQNYINVYLWLPIGYILQSLISRMYTHLDPTGALFSTDNLAMLVFGLLGIVSYSTVPSLSNWMVSAATNQIASKSRNKAQGFAKGSASNAAAGAKAGAGKMKSGIAAIKSKMGSS